jgi:hypothetical protein
VAAGDEVVGVAAHDHAVVAVAHGRPLEAPVADVFQQAARERTLPRHVADVVDTDVPLVAWPAEHVREPARGVVTLE